MLISVAIANTNAAVCTRLRTAVLEKNRSDGCGAGAGAVAIFFFVAAANNSTQ